jgi:hypothetical protein
MTVDMIVAVQHVGRSLSIEVTIAMILGVATLNRAARAGSTSPTR